MCVPQHTAFLFYMYIHVHLLKKILQAWFGLVCNCLDPKAWKSLHLIKISSIEFNMAVVQYTHNILMYFQCKFVVFRVKHPTREFKKTLKKPGKVWIDLQLGSQTKCGINQNSM